MTDFRTAFEAGQDAAIKAELARKEIDSVFAEVQKQLTEITKGKVEIYRQEFEKRPEGVPFAITFFGPKEKYWAVAARNPMAEDNKSRQLAIWDEGRGGYPCTVSWGGMDRTCHDREALEECLASLLADPVVGDKLRRLILLPPPQAGLLTQSDEQA